MARGGQPSPQEEPHETRAVALWLAKDCQSEGPRQGDDKRPWAARIAPRDRPDLRVFDDPLVHLINTIFDPSTTSGCSKMLPT